LQLKTIGLFWYHPLLTRLWIGSNFANFIVIFIISTAIFIIIVIIVSIIVIIKWFVTIEIIIIRYVMIIVKTLIIGMRFGYFVK